MNGKNDEKRKRKTKLRHKVVYAIFRPFFWLYFKLRYNYSYDKFVGDENGLLVLSNHATTMDPFFVAMSFKKPLFFVASDQLFNLGFISRVIEFLVAPIPKTKGVSDIKSVRDIKCYLDEGANVGLFPEGNRTFTGVTVTIPEQIGKLVKLFRKTVVLYNLKGGYLSKPRWARKPRRGVMKGEIKRVLKYEDYKDLSPEEIYKIVKEELYVDAFEEEKSINAKYKGNSRAEYIENVLYFCPKCKSLHTISSKGNKFACKNCGLTVLYDENGNFVSEDSEMTLKTVSEWYDFQNDYIAKHGLFEKTDCKPLVTFPATVYLDERAKRRQKILSGEVSLYSDKVEFCGEGKKLTYPLSEIVGMTPQTMGKMQIYTKSASYVITCAKNFSTLSVVTLYYMNKNKAEGNESGFLGQ